MGDTRPPPGARIPDIETIRLRTAQMAAAGGESWDAATTGEALADVALLLAALDAALTADRGPGIRAAITHALEDAGGV